ncbi:MAG: pimeloyl-ACP methyl ester carboxylesterase [Candidatus Poriferisodalaceae bacterium]
MLLGESFGGALSLSTAIAHPELVDGLVLLNSFPWLHKRWQLSIAPWLLRLVPWAAMPFFRRITESHVDSAHTDTADLVEFHERSRHIGQLGYRRRIEILRTYDVREQLAEMKVPTLLLAGDADRLLPATRWARFMHERMPISEMHTLEGHGHVRLIAHDLDINALVAPWWDSVVAT